MKWLLLTGLAAAACLGILAARLSDWRLYAEAFTLLLVFAVALATRTDYGRDDRFLTREDRRR